MSTVRTPTHSTDVLLRSYMNTLKDNVKCILENFAGIMRTSRRDSIDQLPKMLQSEQDCLEIQVRTANIVRAGESLLKLISDLKEFIILNDFHSVNEAIMNNSQIYRATTMECDKKLAKLRDEMAIDLYDLEEEYYTSKYK